MHEWHAYDHLYVDKTESEAQVTMNIYRKRVHEHTHMHDCRIYTHILTDKHCEMWRIKGHYIMIFHVGDRSDNIYYALNCSYTLQRISIALRMLQSAIICREVIIVQGVNQLNREAVWSKCLSSRFLAILVSSSLQCAYYGGILCNQQAKL